jgi:hypothetical protein
MGVEKPGQETDINISNEVPEEVLGVTSRDKM